VYAIYLLTTSIVLINLLIAMMSDTYQRIQVLMLPNTIFLILDIFVRFSQKYA
jgi:hypothetical protein